MRLLTLSLSFVALACSTDLAQAKGASVSGGRSSVPVSRPSVLRSYTKPAVQSTKVRPSPVKAIRPTTSTTKRKSKVEYEYFELRDCTRIIKPINGYRCIDRD